MPRFAAASLICPTTSASRVRGTTASWTYRSGASRAHRPESSLATAPERGTLGLVPGNAKLDGLLLPADLFHALALLGD